MSLGTCRVKVVTPWHSTTFIRAHPQNMLETVLGHR